MSYDIEGVLESNIVLYEIEGRNVKAPVIFEDEIFWTTQSIMCELFDTSKQNISLHINNIFTENELSEDSVVKEYLTTAADGKKYKTKFYNLDMIIAVGYRVNSKQATKFRQWATGTLKEYIVKGFVMNDEMLKNGRPFGKDYFEELLERIREIRASERRFYQKITDIYSTSYDYNVDDKITSEFFKTVQNKLLFAVTGETAPELIAHRADSSKDNMGLTSFKYAPDGKVLKSDVTISKNYLEESEIKELNSIVTMYLDYAENQANRGKPMSMEDWRNKLDAFLQFNEYDILHNAGKISREVAEKIAHEQYEEFRVVQDNTYISDFDKATEKLLEKKN